MTEPPAMAVAPNSVLNFTRADGSRRRSEALDSPLVWLDAGLLENWMPVPARVGRRLTLESAKVWIGLTEVVDPQRSSTARGWLEHQHTLTTSFLRRQGTRTRPRGPRPSRPEDATTVFWRLAVGNSAVALGATPAGSAEEAVDQASEAVSECRNLEVALGFSRLGPRPDWIIHRAGKPVMIGLPDHQLVATQPAERNLGHLLAEAQLQTYIHRSEQ